MPRDSDASATTVSIRKRSICTYIFYMLHAAFDDGAFLNQIDPPRHEDDGQHSDKQTAHSGEAQASDETNNEDFKQRLHVPASEGGRRPACPPLDEAVIAYVELRR